MTPEEREARRQARLEEHRRYIQQIADRLVPRIITGAELMRLAGLFRYVDLYEAVAWIRDHESRYPYPLVSSNRGYQFSVDPAAFLDFYNWRMRTAITVADRADRVLMTYLHNIPGGDLIAEQLELALRHTREIRNAGLRLVRRLIRP